MISIKNLDKKFNRGKQNEIHVLNDISLDLPESGMVAIFGRSGCGKTTLLNVIGGLDRSQSGSVEMKGERMGVSSDTLRNRSVGYIFQNYCLSKKETCFENVANALRLLGVSDRAFIEEMAAALRGLGAKTVVLTGVAFSPDELGLAVFDGGEVKYYFNERRKRMSHGTGDVFASVFAGGVMRGLSALDAGALAADVVCRSIEETAEDHGYGVSFERAIPLLVERLG